MRRQERIGCWTIFFLPFFAAATVAAWAGFARAAWTVEGVLWLVGMLAIALLFGGLPMLAIRLYAGSKPPPPPPDESVGPRPGGMPRAPDSGVPRLGGRLGKTRIEVEAWEPGRLVRLRQVAGSPVPAIVLMALGLGFLFVFEPTLASGGLEGGVRIGLPHAGSLVTGLWVLTLVFLVTRPSAARVVTIDWEADAVEIVTGRRRTVLGLSRVKTVESRDRDLRLPGGAAHAQSGTPRQIRYKQQLIAWVEPEGGGLTPYLLVETRPAGWDRAQHARETVAPLAEGLATALAVPCGTTEHIGGRDAYE